MMLRVNCSDVSTLRIIHTPTNEKRYMVTMEAGNCILSSQATNALFINWDRLNTDGFVNYQLYDESDVAAVRQFIEDTNGVSVGSVKKYGGEE